MSAANKRVAGELTRAVQKMALLRAMLGSVDVAIREAIARGVPIGFDLPQQVVGAATDLALTLARLDAYERSAEDQGT